MNKSFAVLFGVGFAVWTLHAACWSEATDECAPVNSSICCPCTGATCAGGMQNNVGGKVTATGTVKSVKPACPGETAADDHTSIAVNCSVTAKWICNGVEHTRQGTSESIEHRPAGNSCNGTGGNCPG